MKGLLIFNFIYHAYKMYTTPITHNHHVYISIPKTRIHARSKSSLIAHNYFLFSFSFFISVSILIHLNNKYHALKC